MSTIYEEPEFDWQMNILFPAKYDGPGKGLASRACNWYINARYGFRVAMSLEFFSVEGDPPSKCSGPHDMITPAVKMCP